MLTVPHLPAATYHSPCTASDYDIRRRRLAEKVVFRFWELCLFSKEVQAC